MSEAEAVEEKAENLSIKGEEEEEVKEQEEEGEEENAVNDYGEGGIIDIAPPPLGKEFHAERKKEWIGGAGEYGEGGLFLYKGAEQSEYSSIWGEKESSVSSAHSSEEEVEEEETEQEKEERLEREALALEVRQKMLDRLMLRRRNTFLHKKLVHHFKKRRMEHVFKEEPKGLDLEKKYLKRLYAFKEFKVAQEDEIQELTISTAQFENDTELLEEELKEKLQTFTTRAKEVSLNLILSKTGKRLSEKTVDRLLKRQVKKNEEKGKKRLQYIKIKNLIDEKEKKLKAMEYIGDGLYAGDYEQMKIDNQNLWDKIEEKEDELTKMRLKTESIMQNLSQVREKSYAIEGNTELMAEEVYEVEKTFSEGRRRLTEARAKRDSMREELGRLKSTSGLLTRDDLLSDFEFTIAQAKQLTKQLETMKKQMYEQKKQHVQLDRELSKSLNLGALTHSFSKIARDKVQKEKKKIFNIL